jgi:hypothetical protein
VQCTFVTVISLIELLVKKESSVVFHSQRHFPRMTP